jgi:hypothetical protein
MLAAINRELPFEARIVRREVELGIALTDKRESRKKLRNFSLRLDGRIAIHLKLSPRWRASIGMDIATPHRKNLRLTCCHK